MKEGWPIRGLELIMWPEGQWEDSKKLHKRGQTDKQTDKQSRRKQTDIALYESIGPEGQCFEKIKSIIIQFRHPWSFPSHLPYISIHHWTFWWTTLVNVGHITNIPPKLVDLLVVVDQWGDGVDHTQQPHKGGQQVALWGGGNDVTDCNFRNIV